MSWWTKFRDGASQVGEDIVNPSHLVSDLNDIFGTDPGGPTGVPNDQGSGDVLSFSTDTMTGPENQRIQTTAYMENGGSDMFGSNTAYNEEKEQGSWWDRNGEPIINGLTSLATAYITGEYNKELQHSQNKYNAAEAQKTRDFNLYMSNTAHQREMEDLVAAGLNPANTANGGQGAAGESGAQASGANPPYMGYGDMANTALSLAETMKVLNENKYISPEKKAQIANTIADTTNKSANTEMTHANTNLIKEQAKQIKIDNITREDMNRIEMALKTNQSKEVLQDAISKAMSNAYKAETGELPEQTTLTKAVNIAAAILKGHEKIGTPIDPVTAMRKAIKEIQE